MIGGIIYNNCDTPHTCDFSIKDKDERTDIGFIIKNNFVSSIEFTKNMNHYSGQTDWMVVSRNSCLEITPLCQKNSSSYYPEMEEMKLFLL